MRLEQVDQVGLILFATDAFEFEDFAEVEVGFVADVDQIGLHERFRGRRSDLEGLEDGIDPRHGLGNTFEVAGCSGGVGRGYG